MAKYHHRGFTLLELMIVVAILGVLAAIAYPNYLRYIERGNRADMMAELQQISTRIESEKIVYKRYSAIPISQIAPRGATINSGAFQFPVGSNPLYSVTVWNIDGTPTQVTGNTLSTSSWEIRAEPINTARMKGDGKLTLDSSGKKCWKTKCGKNDEWEDQ